MGLVADDGFRENFIVVQRIAWIIFGNFTVQEG